MLKPFRLVPSPAKKEGHQGISLTHYLPAKQPPPALSSFTARKQREEQREEEKTNMNGRTEDENKNKKKKTQKKGDATYARNFTLPPGV